MATAAAIADHYDSLALIYRHFWGDHIHHGLFLSEHESPREAQLNLLAYCAAACGIHGGERVLDVGCGHGGTAACLAAAYGCVVHGITLSDKQACFARDNAQKTHVEDRVSVQVEDAERAAFPAGAFDVIWTMESSEHFSDKPAYFRKAAVALAPAGRLLLAAWTGAMAHARVHAIAQASLCPELITADEYAQQIAASGLRVSHRADLSRQVMRTWEICQHHARRNRALVMLLPRAARRFVEAIDLLLEAYRWGELTYTVIVGQK